jgi:hypothetical protein
MTILKYPEDIYKERLEWENILLMWEYKSDLREKKLLMWEMRTTNINREFKLNDLKYISNYKLDVYV